MPVTTNEQRFYFIKIMEHFHEKDEIDFILAQKNGLAYFGLFIILCLTTMNTGGRLVYRLGNEFVPFDVDKIRREARHFDVDTIVVALELFKRVGLMIQDENGVLSIPMMSKMVGSVSNTPAAIRQQRYRDRQKEHQLALPEQVNVQESVTNSVTENVTERYERLENRDKRLENRDKSIDIRVENIENREDSLASLGEIEKNSFQEFISLYPRKTIPEKIHFVEKAWNEISPGKELEILTSLRENLRWNTGWQEDGGRFIPTAENWLVNRGFEKRFTPPAPPSEDQENPFLKSAYRGVINS